MAKRYDHIHKYERKQLGNHTVFKCMIPDCPHYIRRELAENKISQCWRCNEAFLMTKQSLKLVKPHCEKCTEAPRNKKLSRKRDKVDRLKELLSSDDLLKALGGK
jgi:hypothetical protein